MSRHVFHITPEDSQKRIDVFLTEQLTDLPSRSSVRKLIDAGGVRVNETSAKAHHRLKAGEDVLVVIPDNFLTDHYIAPEDIALDIFYEDPYLFIINKPSGMLVHPTSHQFSGTLVNALLHHAVALSDANTDIRPGIVHRLDQDTSGLMIVAKDNITHTRLAIQFKRHEIKKHYIALVEGDVEFDEGVIKAPIGRHANHHEKKMVQFDGTGKDSTTYYRVIKRANKTTLISLFPKTGRTHQLRVHMKHLRHPILGDPKYGQKNTFPRLALHARAIGFKHPIDKCWIEFSTPVLKDFWAKVND